MGMSKALQERIFISANILNPHTRFIAVRYGNVLASRGSVIPLFHEQIRQGGPVTITVPHMTRFLLSLEQAVDTVCVALAEAGRGEIYVPRAPSASVINIAHALIGDRKIPLKTVGIRPGEKMHEIMISEEEAVRSVERGDYYALRPMLPELDGEPVASPALASEFSSADSVLDLPGTEMLLKKNKLMVPDVEAAHQRELLR
jgi:UDP-glucose 4-epimerase